MNMLSATIEIQAPRVALCTILNVNTELRNYFLGEEVTVCKVGYPKESDMPRLDMRVLLYVIIFLILSSLSYDRTSSYNSLTS